MNASTQTIQSYGKSTGSINLQVVKGLANENEHPGTAIISIAEKAEPVKVPKTLTGLKGWVMPPMVHGYIKGRNNDPL